MSNVAARACSDTLATTLAAGSVQKYGRGAHGPCDPSARGHSGAKGPRNEYAYPKLTGPQAASIFLTTSSGGEPDAHVRLLLNV